MDREYDLFEVLRGGSLVWRDSVTGHENAIRRLRELVEHTPHLMQRFSRLLTAPHIALLHRRKPKPFLLGHKHHL
jgi:hypothetical protein